MVLEKATWDDLLELAQLYDTLNDTLSAGTNYPGWKKGVYPTIEDARAGINEDALYVARMDGRIAGTFILRRRQEPGYALVDWHIQLAEAQVFVLYTFAIHPDYQKRGLGARMLRHVIACAAAQGGKAVRLDVYEHNAPAIRLYERCGFQLIDTVDLGYAAYGLERFRLYQQLIVPRPAAEHGGGICC